MRDTVGSGARMPGERRSDLLLRLVLLISAVTGSAALLLGAGQGASAGEPPAFAGPGGPQSGDTRSSEGWVVFRQCRDGDCGPVENETSLRITSLYVSGFRWPKLYFASSGTLRFAGDPATGRAPSRLATGIELSVDFSKNGQWAMSTSLAADWQNALGIPGLHLDDVRLSGVLSRYGEMTWDASASVVIDDVLSADLAGTLVLRQGEVRVDVSAEADVAWLGHVFTDADVLVTPQGLHVDGTAGITGYGSVSAVGDLRMAGGVVDYDMTAALDIEAAGLALTVPPVHLVGAIDLDWNTIAFTATIGVPGVIEATLDGDVTMVGGNPTLTLSGQSSLLVVGGLDVDFGATVRLVADKLQVTADADVGTFARVSAVGDVWHNGGAIEFDLDVLGSFTTGGFSLPISATIAGTVGGSGTVDLATDVLMAVGGLGSVEVSATLDLATGTVSFDGSGALDVEGFTIDAAFGGDVWLAADGIHISGDVTVTDVGTVSLDGRVWTDAGAVNYDFTARTTDLTFGGFTIAATTLHLAGTVGVGEDGITLQGHTTIGDEGGTVTQVEVDVSGRFWAEADGIHFDVTGEGGVGLGGFQVYVPMGGFRLSGVVGPETVAAIQGNVDVPEIASLAVAGTITSSASDPDPYRLHFDMTLHADRLNIASFDLADLDVGFEGYVDLDLNDEDGGLPIEARLTLPTGTPVEPFVDVAGKVWVTDPMSESQTTHYRFTGKPGAGIDFLLWDFDVAAPDWAALTFEGTLGFVVNGDGVHLDATLDLVPGPTWDDVTIDGRFWHDEATGSPRYHFDSTSTFGLFGFEFAAVDLDVDSITGVSAAGTLDVDVAQVGLSGAFRKEGGNTRFDLSANHDFALNGFTFSSGDIHVRDTGVTAAGQVSIPGLGNAAMSGSLDKSSGSLQYSLTGQTATSLVGFNTTAHLTLGNPGMYMTTTLNNGAWINHTFAGYVASNGAFDISTNGTLNLTNLVTGSTGIATTFRFRSTGGSVTLQSSTTVALLGFDLTFAGTVSASGFTFTVRAPTSGTQRACLELLVVRGCVNYYYEFTLASATGLKVDTYGSASVEVWLVFCLCWVGGDVGGIGYEYSWDANGAMHLTISVSVLGFPPLPIPIF